jgi:hypothetical protein
VLVCLKACVQSIDQAFDLCSAKFHVARVVH